MGKTIDAILNDWENEKSGDWFAVDRIKTDGTMVRLFVGRRDDAESLAMQYVIGDTVDYDGSTVAPGVFEAPFHRMALVSEEAARDYFEGLMADVDDVGRMYTVGEAAERMGIHRQSVYGLIRRGSLRAELVAGEWRVTGGAIARRGC